MSLMLISQAYSFFDDGDDDGIVNSANSECPESRKNSVRKFIPGNFKGKNNTKYQNDKVNKAKYERQEAGLTSENVGEIPNLFEQWPFKQFKFVFNFESETSSEHLKEGWKKENKTFVFYENLSKDEQDETKEITKSQLALANNLESNKIDKEAKVAVNDDIFTPSFTNLLDQMESKIVRKVESGQQEKIATKHVLPEHTKENQKRRKNSTYVKGTSVKSKPTGRKMLYPNQCIICLKQFPSYSKLTHHLIIHTREKPFSCSICNDSFVRLSYLKSHMPIHKGVFYKCKACDKNFNRLDSLKRHERNHSGKKPYHCLICDKRFTRLESLNRHKRLHTGERPYQCSICSKSFPIAYNLARHEQTHTLERKFECLVCENRFTRRDSLQFHSQNHCKLQN